MLPRLSRGRVPPGRLLLLVVVRLVGGGGEECNDFSSPLLVPVPRRRDGPAEEPSPYALASWVWSFEEDAAARATDALDAASIERAAGGGGDSPGEADGDPLGDRFNEFRRPVSDSTTSGCRPWPVKLSADGRAEEVVDGAPVSEAVPFPPDAVRRRPEEGRLEGRIVW
jgi:hypothetical protein